jgi:hypothetical protein
MHDTRLLQVIEVVHGGAAQRSKAVRVGDILLMADGGMFVCMRVCLLFVPRASCSRDFWAQRVCCPLYITHSTAILFHAHTHTHTHSTSTNSSRDLYIDQQKTCRSLYITDVTRDAISFMDTTTSQARIAHALYRPAEGLVADVTRDAVSFMDTTTPQARTLTRLMYRPTQGLSSSV